MLFTSNQIGTEEDIYAMLSLTALRVERAKGAILRFETNYFGFRGGNHQALYEDFHISNVSAGTADNYAILWTAMKNIKSAT